MPGVSVTLVWLTVAKGGVHHRRDVPGEVAEQRHVMIGQGLTDGELADQSVSPTATERDVVTDPAPDHPTAREIVPEADGRDQGGFPRKGLVAGRGQHRDFGREREVLASRAARRGA